MPENAILKRSAPISPLPQAVSDRHLIDLWLHGRSPHTQRAYVADAVRFLVHVQKPLDRITLAELVEFAKTLEELAAASQYRILSSIKSLFAFGHRIGYLPLDVGRVLRVPSVPDRLAHRILPEAEVHRMLSLEPDQRNRALLTLLYASGMRVHELCGLRWRDLAATADGGQVSVLGKGNKARSIRLPDSVWKLLTGLGAGGGREGSDPVFVSRKRRALSEAQIWRLVLRRRPAGRHRGEGLASLDAARPRFPCPGPGRSHPLGASDPRPCEPGYDEPLSSRPTERELQPFPGLMKKV